MARSSKHTGTLVKLHRRWLIACVTLTVLALVPLLVLNLPQAAPPDPPTSWPLQAASLGMVLRDTREDGVYVLAVMQDSPAEKAGIQVGDQLLSLNGTALSAASDVDTLLASAKETSPLSFELMRQGMEEQISFRSPGTV